MTGVFDAGIPGFPEFHEHIYARLRALDQQGKLPIYVDGCYVISAAWEAEKGIRELKRLRREYNTPHLKVHTLKLFMDGTLKLHSGAMVTPYVETGEKGCNAMNLEEVVSLLKVLNEEGLDFHVHTVGEASSRLVLDAVEQVKKELGDDFRIRVVSAHLQIQDTADLTRFAPLGVIANFTPWWHSDDVNVYKRLFGEERGKLLYRCKSVWDSGALVAWSSDTIVYADFSTWNPYLGMEIGMTRKITKKSKAPEMEWSIIYSRLKMREWELKRCCWDIRLTAQSSSALKRRRALSRPARMRTSWYSGPTCSRRSMRALATTSRKPSILPDGR